MSIYRERGKWVCRMTLRGQVEEFMADRRQDAMHMAVRWVREILAKEACNELR